MGSKIHGIDVTLYARTQTGTDAFGAPVYAEAPLTVHNVLVSPASSDDMPELLDLRGKKAIYTLGIPKEDTHTWEDCKVEFFGKAWRVLNVETLGIDDLVPLAWNKKVRVEWYE